MADRPALIQQVASITGCNEYQAETVLEGSNWHVERAVNSYFDSPPLERPPPNANSQSSGSSSAVVPFQGPSPESGASGWDVPNNPAYAPPAGPPPAAGSGWGLDNKDLIDFTNDNDTDEDLRRAMAASLQDHQFQQAYRPPAPSSTVDVSCATPAIVLDRPEQSDARMGDIDANYYDALETPQHLPSSDDGSCVEASGRRPARRLLEQQSEAQSHKYGLRDRRKLARPINTAQTLFELGRITRNHKTYGSRGRGRRGGRGGRGALRDRRWNMQDLGLSEDEQLRQALEASVQSHHDLMQSSGSGARTPALPQHLETDLQSRRAQGAPVAMAAPFTSLEIVAAMLQALFAAPPVRAAYLAARPLDTRGSDLSNYWKGASPTDASTEAAASQPTLDSHMDLARRIQTLFAFATLSQRPLCVVKDVTALAPNEVIARGADRSPADKVASLFYEFVVDSFTKHVAAVSDTILKTPGTEPTETDALWMNDALFLSNGAAALAGPTASAINGVPDGSGAQTTVAPPKAEQRRSYIELRHDSINSDTYSCLRAALASDGDGALLTRTASVISMGVDHAIPTADGGPPPFTINERLYLDSLMWDRRQGARLDAELRDDEMMRLNTIRQDLDARRRKLIGDTGRPSSEVLSGAKRYFEHVATPADGADPIRAASLAEAGPQISKILEAVQADIAATDHLLGRVRAQIDAKRALVAERAKREASNPEWMQLAYDLCAVLYQEGGRCVSLVKQQSSATWWKIIGGRAVQVEREDVVMGRAQDPSLGVFWLVYARAEEQMGSSAQDKERAIDGLISESIKAAIVDDNLTYESELLSLIRSDAATPSSSATDEEQNQQQMDGGEEAVKTSGSADRNASQDITMTIDPTSEVTLKSPRTS